MTTYNIKYGVKMKLFTATCVLFLMAQSILLLNNWWLLFLLGIVLILTFTIVSFFPTKFTETEQGFTINTLFSSVHLKRSDVISISQVKYLHYPMTWSTKGVFGYLGVTMDETLSMITDDLDVVLIKTKHKNYLISIENSTTLCSSFG